MNNSKEKKRKSRTGKLLNKNLEGMPNYLGTSASDDVELAMIKNVARRCCVRLLADGMVSENIARIQFYDLGDDIPSPLNAPGLEAKVVALARFLIEQFYDGRRIPIWRERFSELKRLDMQFELTPIVAEFFDIKKKRKTINKANAQKPRPAAQSTDYDEIRSAFAILVREGHTEREARGILGHRGVASTSTIYRATKAK